MSNQIQKKENSPAQYKNQYDAPGFGVAGKVMCKYTGQACLKDCCENWMELNYGEQKVGRCADFWNAYLKVETRQEIERLRLELAEFKEMFMKAHNIKKPRKKKR